MKKIFGFGTALFCTILVSAQTHVQYAKDTVGSMHYPNWSLVNAHINSTVHFSKAQLAVLEQSLKKEVETVLNAPQFHPAKGFQLVTKFEPIDCDLAGLPSLPAVKFDFNFHYFLSDSKNNSYKKSMDFVTLTLEVNRIDHLVEEQGSFADDCKRLHLPAFFEQFPITDSTVDYIEFNFKNYSGTHTIPAMPIRIVVKSGPSLFVPFSRREYFQYLLSKKQAEITETEKSLALFQNEVIRLQKEAASATDSAMKKAMEISKQNLEKEQPAYKGKLTKLKTEQQRYHDLMEAMSPQEAAAPAWINKNRLGVEMDYLDVLLPYGQRSGVMLNKVNPVYFNAKGGVQLITVYGVDDETPNPDYLEEKTIQLFQQIDYHQLKVSLQ